MRRVVVTGVGGPAGRAVSAFFRGCACSVIGTDIAAVNGGLDGFFLVPPGDAWEFSPAMLRILAREKPFLFVPTVTEELPQAARMKQTVRELGISMFISDFDAVRVTNDKYLTAKTLQIFGIEVPETLADEEVENALEAGETIGYPFIAKPRAGRGGRGVSVYLAPKDAAREKRRGIVYQQFLGGDEYDVNLFAYPEGTPIVTRVLLKTSLKGGIVGNAASVEIVNEPDIAALAMKAVEVLRLEGPIDIDIRRGIDGIPGIIEINARVGANVLQAEGILETMMMESLKGGIE